MKNLFCKKYQSNVLLRRLASLTAQITQFNVSTCAIIVRFVQFNVLKRKARSINYLALCQGTCLNYYRFVVLNIRIFFEYTMIQRLLLRMLHIILEHLLEIVFLLLFSCIKIQKIIVKDTRLRYSIYCSILLPLLLQKIFLAQSLCIITIYRCTAFTLVQNVCSVSCFF